MQIIYQIRDLYVEYIGNYYNSTIKRQPNLKMSKDSNRHFPEEGIQMANQPMEKMLKIVCHQGNASENHNEILLYTC